jgi:SSS family solute:Na+ symporter
VLSVVSIITFILSKIAVGIFAGGVVFSTLLPELQFTVGGHLVDSFWIGSVLVILLTGLYTALGGMRAVAYNDAVQVTVLILGSALLTIYGLITLGGWSELKALCGSDMFNLWKPLTPAGVESTWAPVMERNSAGELVKQAWYFNTNYPWLGMAICAPVIGLWYWCTDQYIVQRALGAPNEKIARRGSIFAAVLKLFPVYLFIIPGLICFALAKSGKGDLACTSCVPPLGSIPLAHWLARNRCCGAPFCVDGFACGSVQCVLYVVHYRYLRKVSSTSESE